MVQQHLFYSKVEAGSFEAISCMSVTKWIHLHGGDSILAAFFQKVEDALAPGGFFILEPQPWKSYKAAVRKLASPFSGGIPSHITSVLMMYYNATWRCLNSSTMCTYQTCQTM